MIMIVGDDALQPLFACLEQLAGVRKTGVAPMSHLERRLNTYLDDEDL